MKTTRSTSFNLQSRPGSWLLALAVFVLAGNCVPLIAGYPNNINDADDEFTLQFGPPGAIGVSEWYVSQPWINLWIVNKPVGYYTSYDKAAGFAAAFKQRNTRPRDGIGDLGPGWELSGLSFISHSFWYDPNAPVTLYAALGGSSKYISDGTTKDIKTRSTMRRLYNANQFAGYEVNFPSGAKQRFQYGLQYSGNRLFLSEDIDANGRVTTYGYDFADGYVRVRTITDPDWKVLNINYYPNDGTNFCWQIREVIDPYDKKARFKYAAGSPYRLTEIVNSGGLTNTFHYDSQGLITNAITVYGTNLFRTTTNAFAPYNLGGTNQVNRAVEITEANGDRQLFVYRDQSTKLNLGSDVDLLPYSYPTNQVPNTWPLTNTFDNAWMDARNSFHWNPHQFSLLSTNYRSSSDVNQLTLADYKGAHLMHWLRGYTNEAVVTPFLSVARNASSDGALDGQKHWHDYAGKSGNWWTRGTNGQPSFSAVVLPDGTSKFLLAERNFPWEHPTKIVSSYASGAGIALRTNTFAYATNGIDLTEMRGPGGQLLSSNNYNTCHQVVTNWNALNERTSLAYNSLSRVIRVERPSGLLTTNIYAYNYYLAQTIDCDSSFSIAVRTNTFYRLNGLLTSYNNERDLFIQYGWNALQLPVSATYPIGTVSNIYTTLDLTGTKSITGLNEQFSYDRVRQLVTYKDPSPATNGLTLQSVYSSRLVTSVTNALGQTNAFTYDRNGRLLSVTYHDKSAEIYGYDLLGRLIWRKDAAGVATTNWFNNQGLLCALSNALGRVVQYQYDVRDRVTNMVDANGNVTTLVYDDLDRVVRRSVAGGAAEGFLYSARGLIAHTNQLGKVTRYGLDALGRKIAETNANNEVTRYSYSPAGDLIMLIDPKGQTNRWTYDKWGRVKSVIDANGATIVQFNYDNEGRLASRWTASHGYAYYSYDNNGNLLSGHGGTYGYDSLNRLIRYSVPGSAEGGAISYTSFGAVASENGPWANDTISYGYTTNHLRQSLSLEQPNAPPWVQTYGYDAANRLQTLASPAGAFAYSYQSPAALINRITLPGGAYITNTYDNLARLTGTYLRTSAGALLNAHSYLLNDANQRTRQTRADGSYVDYAYDNIGQLISAVAREPGGAARLHENLGYGYDLAGNLNSRTNNALVQTFNHNSLNELTTVTRAGTLTVAGNTTAAAAGVQINGLAAALYGDKSFARAGFSLVSGTNSFTAVAQDSLGRADTNSVSVNPPATVSYQYDANGNLTSDGTRVFSYDWDDRLQSVEVPYQWKVTFYYDGLGRLRFRRNSVWNVSLGWEETGVETRYLYDGKLVIQERDQDNVPTVTYTRGLDLSATCCDGMGGIGGLLARTDNSALSIGSADAHAYYHADGNGNVTMLVNAAQQITAKYLYDPFGNVIAQSGHMAEANVYRFSSKEYHEKSGLYYFGARFYDPNLQRWLNREPIGTEGGLNLYAYVGNGPVNAFDAWGLDFWFTDSEEVALRYSGLFQYADSEVIAKVKPDIFNSSQMAGFQDEQGLHKGWIYSTSDDFLPYTITGEQLQARLEIQLILNPPASIPSERDPNTYNALLIGAPNLVGTGPGEQMAGLNGDLMLAAILGADPARRAAKRGETAFTKAGRDAHRAYNPGPTYDTRFRLPSRRRPDAVDFDARIVRELKPNNPRAIRRGEKQAEQYVRELREIFGGDWKGVVDTYP